jgi:hypothetical protein
LIKKGEFGKRVPIPIINAIGARTPHSDTDRILLDVNVVRPIPIKVLHYFEVEDMLKAATTPSIPFLSPLPLLRPPHISSLFLTRFSS